MAADIGASVIAGAMQAQTGRLLAQAETGASSKQDAKIDKAARDFESILLSSWLQKAEASFGSVPGGDEENEDDPGKSQLQAIAVQALGSSLAASGGIGIARMIADHLKSAADKPSPSGTQTHAERMLPLRQKA
jgi:Rod binding domain-containing protein